MDALSFDLSSQSNAWSFAPTRKSKSAVSMEGSPALHNMAETFAADIARRISGAAMPDIAPKTEQGGAPAENSIYGVTSQDLKDLEKALSGVINKIIDSFGVKAGAVAQALVYKKIGEEEVTEDSLAGGLLDALKFIDKQFGPEAGDELIAFMNRGVNKELNEFFDNGHNEEFYVSTGVDDAVAGKAAAGGQMLGAWLDQTEESGGGGGTSILDVLKQLAKDLEEKLQREMQKDAGALPPGEISAQLSSQLDAYAAQSAPEGLAPGMILEQAV